MICYVYSGGTALIRGEELYSTWSGPWFHVICVESQCIFYEKSNDVERQVGEQHLEAA